MAVTMADIAREAGVGVATVGRVIHRNGYVSHGARERVERAVRELGYIPNQSARALKGRRSGIVGSLVLQSVNGLYYRINESIVAAARQAGCEVVTMEAQSSQADEARLIQDFIGLRVDGLVITSNTRVTPDMFALLRQAEIPVVAVERGYLDQGIDSLIVQDEEGVHDAVWRMWKKGHRRIAYIGVRPYHPVEERRLQGYTKAMAEAGLEPGGELLRLCDGYDPQAGKRAAEALFALAKPPTAIFCAADTLAAGVLQAAYTRRLRVPWDLSLAGCDDVLSRSLSPAIDSVGLVLEPVGRKVMELLSLRRQDPAAPAMRREIKTVYRDRGSVAELSIEKSF